jgi:hypothetical protein
MLLNGKLKLLYTAIVKPFTDEDYSRNREIIFSGKKVHKTKFTHNSIYKSTYKPY